MLRDSVYVDFFANGTKFFTSNRPWSLGTMAANSNEGLINNGTTDWSTLGLGGSMTQFTLCASSRLRKNGNEIDVNINNDDFCQTITYAGDNNDFDYDVAPDSVLISLPPFDAGAHIPMGTPVLEVQFVLRNIATQIFPGVTIDVEFTAGSASYQTTLIANTNISAPGATPVTLDNITLALPTTKGPFDFCVEVTDALDTDGSNNKTCTEYIMGNPDAVEEVAFEDLGSVFYNNGVLNVSFNDNINGMANVQLFETSGKLVGDYDLAIDLTKSHNISVNELNEGVYIANITVNGLVKSYRFIK